MILNTALLSKQAESICCTPKNRIGCGGKGRCNLFCCSCSGGCDLSTMNKHTDSPYLKSAGRILVSNSYLLSSNEKYSAEMQHDGNFVIYVRIEFFFFKEFFNFFNFNKIINDFQDLVNRKPLWASGTFDYEKSFLTMQTDGDLVLYSFKFAPLWKSNTSGVENYLKIEDNGNLVICDSNNFTIWSTNTTQIM